MSAFLAFVFLAVTYGTPIWAGDIFQLSDFGEEATPNPPTLCGEALTADTGTITSPNYPDNYPNWANCVWTITAPDGKLIALTFDAFDVDTRMSSQFGCKRDRPNDSVSLFNGAVANSTEEIDLICPDLHDGIGELPFTIASSSNILTIQFLSNYITTATGFSASYSFFECGGTLTDEIGEFATPENYINWLNCEWTIKAQEGKSIELRFRLYDVNKKDCLDYVEIYDAGTGETTKRCNNKGPTRIVSRGDLTIRYVTQPWDYKGEAGVYDGWTEFRASYSSVDNFFELPDFGYASTLNPPTLCGETLTADTGTITSPNYPENYPNWANCVWTITAPEGKVVALTFDAFNVDTYMGRFGCGKWEGDYVEVIDGAEANLLDAIEVICPNKDGELEELPYTITSTSNSMTVQFVANQFNTRTGFSASYSFV